MNILIGFLTGLAASMGLGGGFILIIYLTVFWGVGQAAAQGVNLLFFLPIALFSAIIHSKNKLIEWKIVPFSVVAGVIGAALGSFLSFTLDETVLRMMFAGLVLLIGLKEVFYRKKSC